MPACVITLTLTLIMSATGMDSEPPELLQLLARPPNARAPASAGHSTRPADAGQATPQHAQHRDSSAAGPPAAARRQSFGAVNEAELQASQYGSSSQPVAAADRAPGSPDPSPDPSPGAWGAPRRRDVAMPGTQASQAEAAFPDMGGAQNPQNPGHHSTNPRPPAVEGAVVASNYGTGNVVAMRFEAAPAAVSLAARAAGAQGLLARRRQGFGGISVRPAGGELCFTSLEGC